MQLGARGHEHHRQDPVRIQRPEHAPLGAVEAEQPPAQDDGGAQHHQRPGAILDPPPGLHEIRTVRDLKRRLSRGS